MAEIAESYLSIRRKEKFSYNGYSFRFDKNSTKDPELSFWRCDNGTCKARLHLRDGAVVQEVGEHLSHAPNQPKIAAAIAVSRMKDQARNTRDSTRQILADTQEGLSETTIIKCGEVADKYIEYDSVIIFLDVLLLQRPVYRHILVNSKVKGYWQFLLVLWLCDALTKLMQRKAGDPSPRLQPDHVFYSALEWHFYQDYLLSAAESLVFFFIIVGLLAGKHALRNRNLKHFECEALLRAMCVSSMGRLLVVPALIWGESYSAVGVALTHLFVASSTVQALRVVSKKTSILQAGVVVAAGYGVQAAVLALVKSTVPAYSLFSSIHLPNTTRWADMFS